MAFGLVMAPASFGNVLGIPWEEMWRRYHPLVYTVKTIAAAILLWVFRRSYTPIRVTHVWVAIIAGVVGIVEWIGVDEVMQRLWPTLTLPAATYDPVTSIPDAQARYAFYAARITGAVLVVPIMEELFYRDFLTRALIRPSQFQAIPIGTFSWASLIGVSALFAVSHVQWPSAFFYGLMLGALVVYTRSLGACIITHAITNLALAGYVLITGEWRFW